MNVKVVVPDRMGDVMSDLNTRRGQVQERNRERTDNRQCLVPWPNSLHHPAALFHRWTRVLHHGF
jgi:translation elongation factor EF-G